MATYTADVTWTLRDGEEFPRGRYSRGHTVSFDGGITVPASASPHVVGKWAVEAAVDPEEMLVAALSNCHMLSFLHVARLAGFTVAAYRDHAEGVMEHIAPAKQAVTNRDRVNAYGILSVRASSGKQISAQQGSIRLDVHALIPLERKAQGKRSRL